MLNILKIWIIIYLFINLIVAKSYQMPRSKYFNKIDKELGCKNYLSSKACILAGEKNCNKCNIKPKISPAKNLKSILL